jgi:hypothetical protein
LLFFFSPAAAAAMGFVFAMAGTGGDWGEVPLPLGFRGFSEREELASLRLNVGLVHNMGHKSQCTEGQGPISNKQLPLKNKAK